jgi:hypothetical protein
MTGELSQMIWLTSAANAYLIDRLDPADFYPGNPIFHHSRNVRFVQSGWLGTKTLAEEPRTWLVHIRAEGAKRAHLCHTSQTEAPTHHGNDSINGDTWTIQLDYPGHRDHWTTHWQTAPARAGDGKIWSITYRLTHRVDYSLKPHEPLLPIVKEMKTALASIRHFTDARQMQHWTDIFDSALQCLDLEPSFPDYVKPVCLNHYPRDAQRLLAASYRAWVFGGMGSWNDLVFSLTQDNETHDSLSRLLHATIVRAVQESVNSFEMGEATDG